MNSGTARLETLTRAEASALRAVLVAATAAAGRSFDRIHLAQLVAAAPIEALPAAAALHRIDGTVLRGLEGVDGVPESVRRQLAAMRTRASLHHLMVMGPLHQIGRLFDEAGLAWVVIKGPFVASHLYADVGDRAYADLDLLVDRRDFPQAVRLLEGLGYQHTVHDWALAERMLAGEIGMEGAMVPVDLHWNLLYSREVRRPFSIEPEEMVARARRVVVSGATVPTLDPVDTVLTLAFHAAKSDGHRLLWLKDVERAIAVDHPDLDELVRRARANGCAAPVGLILARARELVGALVPAEVIRAMSPAPLRAANRIVTSLSDPVQLHEKTTIARFFTRSIKASIASTLLAVPERAARSFRRVVFPTRVNETDSETDKSSYLAAVVASIEQVRIS